jgi:hypothetical protein
MTAFSNCCVAVVRPDVAQLSSAENVYASRSDFRAGMWYMTSYQ